MPSQHGLSHSFSIFHHDRNVEDQLFGFTFIDSQSSYIREPMRQILFIQQVNGKRKKLRSSASFFPWQHSYLSSSKFVPIWFYIPNFPCFNSDPHSTASSTSSGESAPSTTLASTSMSSFTSLPSLVAISAEILSQAISQAFQQSLPQMLAGERRRKILPAAGLAIPARPLPW